MSVTAALARHAERMPGRDALVFEDQRIGWRSLNEVVDRLAVFIAARTSDRSGIALHLPTGVALTVLFLAAARTGREAQVLDPDWPLEMTRTILAQLSPALVISSDPQLASDRTAILADPYLPLEQVAATLGVSADAIASSEPDELLPFYVGFTSGSTGMPKGYRRHHRSWTESFRHDALEFGIGSDDVILAPGTLTHSLFLYALMNGLNAGACVILCRRFRPDTVVRLIDHEHATILYGVPTQLQMTIKAAGDRSLATMRWVLSSGAKWPTEARQQLLRLFPAAQFAEFYGASETSFMTVAKASENSPETSVGRAFSGVDVTIRDRSGHRLPMGEPGYVFVESALLFMNYANGDADDVLRAGNAMSVGDIGFLDARGFLHLVGRASRKIVTSGKNVYPEEIERVLERHPAIVSAAVLGVPDAERGERLVALLRLQPGASVTCAQLIAHARAALPLAKVPRVYAVVPEWPLTRSGKTDFEALRRGWSAAAFARLP